MCNKDISMQKPKASPKSKLSLKNGKQNILLHGPGHLNPHSNAEAALLGLCPCEFSVSLILQAHKGWAQGYQQSSLLPCSQLLENLSK